MNFSVLNLLIFKEKLFYNNLMEDFIEILEEHDLLEESEGALVVNLEEEGMPPCLIRKIRRCNDLRNT